MLENVKETSLEFDEKTENESDGFSCLLGLIFWATLGFYIYRGFFL